MMKISAIQEENISNVTTASTDASSTGGEMYPPPYFPAPTAAPPPPAKKKRSQPGHPDPGSEVISLSPRTLMATNRFVCEICSKGFQRDQNLQLHRRGHNLPWKLKQRNSKEVRKKVYVCPETSCVHHDPSRALGDLTGIKKHFCRKHGEKKWKCDKCSKKYAVQSDWKAHSKTCGTREYRCDCGTLFSRRDSFITHRAFCDALAEESAKTITPTPTTPTIPPQNAANSFSHHINLQQIQSQFSNAQQQLSFPIKKENQPFTLRPPWLPPPPNIDLTTPSSIFQDFQENTQNPNPNTTPTTTSMGPTTSLHHAFHHHHPPPHISATALLQRAAELGSKSSTTPTPTRPYHPHVPAGESPASGFGLKLASRDQFINGLPPFGNKAAASSSPSMLHHDMMMINTSFQHHNQESTFEDDDLSFAGMLNNANNNTSPSSHTKRVDESLDFDATLNQFSASNGGNHDDRMTRDFLGLRPLSQSDILSLAGLSNCINTTSCGEHQSQSQRSWQG